MKIFILAVAMAVLIPAAAFAAASAQSPEDWCRANPGLIGDGKTYKNFGACVASRNDQQETNTSNTAAPTQSAEDWCKANPVSIGDGKTYKNFGACVSAHNDQQETNAVNAAKTCKAERASIGVDAFATKYGTNKNKKNAFGKCVSKIASAKTGQQQAAETKADNACKTDATLKAQIGEGKTYRNFGACVSAQAKKKK